jgi:hypothetical protein
VLDTRIEMATRIEVQIERLVVTGLRLGGRDSRLFRAAVEAELSRLLEQGDFADGAMGAAVPALGSGVTWSRGERPEALGARVGQAVYGSLAK